MPRSVPAIPPTGDIAAFVCAVDAGSFAAAALRLGLTRSAVAKAVSRLEARLGVRLLSRTTRRLAPTEDGRRFHAECSDALDALSRAETAVSHQGATPAGTLRLAVPDAFGRRRVMPVVSDFLRRFPATRVELHLSDRTDPVVAAGLDLAIRLGLPDDLPPDLIARVVSHAALGFFAAPDYLARRGEPGTLDALRDHDVIPYDTPGRRRLLRRLDPDGTWTPVPAASRLSVDSGEGMLDAALHGLGIAYLPDFLTAPAVAAGRLRPVLPGLASGRLPVVAVYPGRRNLPARTRAFLDLLAPPP